MPDLKELLESGWFYYGALAKTAVEHLTFNQVVGGSIPSRSTILTKLDINK